MHVTVPINSGWWGIYKSCVPPSAAATQSLSVWSLAKSIVLIAVCSIHQTENNKLQLLCFCAKAVSSHCELLSPFLSFWQRASDKLLRPSCRWKYRRPTTTMTLLLNLHKRNKALVKKWQHLLTARPKPLLIFSDKSDIARRSYFKIRAWIEEKIIPLSVVSPITLLAWFSSCAL